MIGSLLETVEGLLKLTNDIFSVMMLKTLWKLHGNFFIQISMKKSIANVELIEVLVFNSYNG